MLIRFENGEILPGAQNCNMIDGDSNTAVNGSVVAAAEIRDFGMISRRVVFSHVFRFSRKCGKQGKIN